MVVAEENWLDRIAYPYEPHFLDLDAGKLHYVDEGDGPPIVMVHGTPTWSYLYRHLINGLRDNYRVIAPDHLGFGLSDKPQGHSYLPKDQAANLTTLIEHLNLTDITLVVHDFGGPIGLNYAVDHPQNVKRVVLFNTWMWSLADERDKAIIGRVFGTRLGRFLYEQFKFSVNVMLPTSYADKSKLTPAIHSQYRGPFEEPQARYATWVYARELLQSGDWYDSMWNQREQIKGVPALLVWGRKDPAFGSDAYLTRWQSVFDHQHTVAFDHVGHFVQEEKGTELVPILADFLAG